MLRKKEMIKVRQPLQRVMIPVLDANQKAEIEAVEELIRAEVNVKEIQLLDDASGVLVKQVKPNFKALGPKVGKDMSLVAKEIQNFSQEQIAEIEAKGSIDIAVLGKIITLTPQEVEISTRLMQVLSSGFRMNPFTQMTLKRPWIKSYVILQRESTTGQITLWEQVS